MTSTTAETKSTSSSEEGVKGERSSPSSCCCTECGEGYCHLCSSLCSGCGWLFCNKHIFSFDYPAKCRACKTADPRGELYRAGPFRLGFGETINESHTECLREAAAEVLRRLVRNKAAVYQSCKLNEFKTGGCVVFDYDMADGNLTVHFQAKHQFEEIQTLIDKYDSKKEFIWVVHAVDDIHRTAQCAYIRGERGGLSPSP